MLDMVIYGAIPNGDTVILNLWLLRFRLQRTNTHPRSFLHNIGPHSATECTTGAIFRDEIPAIITGHRVSFS